MTNQHSAMTSAPYSILIADDHEIVRDGLKSMLAMFDEFNVVGEAKDGLETIQAFDSLCPDILLLDLSMPGLNGALTTKKIMTDHPDAKILILTAHYADEYLYSTLEAGAMGYILKEQPSDELIHAIKTVLKGEPYLSPKISSHIISSFVAAKREQQYSPSFATLTVREREVLSLVALGKTSKSIAEQLHLSVKTVEKHRSNLLKKTGLHNASALTEYAIKHGLVIKTQKNIMEL
ncbi:response regulator [Desulfoplanes formicivorans]|nr:response regulator transcription factor [Desulfoplanes formicivorans]